MYVFVFMVCHNLVCAYVHAICVRESYCELEMKITLCDLMYS